MMTLLEKLFQKLSMMQTICSIMSRYRTLYVLSPKKWIDLKVGVQVLQTVCLVPALHTVCCSVNVLGLLKVSWLAFLDRGLQDMDVKKLFSSSFASTWGKMSKLIWPPIENVSPRCANFSCSTLTNLGLQAGNQKLMQSLITAWVALSAAAENRALRY